SSRLRITVSGKCSRWMPSSVTPEAFAVVTARSMSAISASVRVTSQDVSRSSASPRQALAVVIGVMRISLTGLASWLPDALLVSRIEGVAQAVAQDVQGHDDPEDHQARVERHPRRLREIALGCVEHAAPGRRGRLLDQAQ